MALLKIRDQIYSGIIGHAIGDALGVPVEFTDRETLRRSPVSGMIGFGSHGQPAGTWSDDTSMEIALMQSIIDNGKINLDDVMQRFCDWLLDNKYTATGSTFDSGVTCSSAIYDYLHNKNVHTCGRTDERSNGNGSLMRILPIAFICYGYGLSGNARYLLVRNISALTHAHEISVLGCYIYVDFVCHLLDGKDKFTAYEHTQEADYSMFSDESLTTYHRILYDNIYERKEDEIQSSGYVVSSLEAALWCLLTSGNYPAATLKAVNLGRDTDTVAAITGSMAGICYPDSVPLAWLSSLKRIDYLTQIARDFAEIDIAIDSI